MWIIKTNEPGQDIIRDIKRVEQACKEHDGLRGSVSLDEYSSRYDEPVPAV